MLIEETTVMPRPTQVTIIAGQDKKQDDAALLDSAVRKNFRRFLPVLCLAMMINYMDRVCVGFAALTMNQDLGITSVQFGLASGVLFIGYCLFEVPSNLALYRVGARVWLARIMITWGVMAAANALVVGPVSLYIARFLLGAAEAGFFPGAAYLLSIWFPAAYRTRALAWLSLAIPVSSVVAGPISTLLLHYTHGWLGLLGWQWMFIVEGLPACAMGFVILRLVTDDPKDARWLTRDEQTVLLSTLAEEKKAATQHSLRAAFSDPRVFILTGVQFGFVLGSYGISLWLPQILKQYDLSVPAIGMLSTAPYLLATVAMLVWARIADRSNAILGNLIITCVVTVVGLLIAAIDRSLAPAIIGLTIALIGVTAARAIFWAIPARFLSGAAAAGGLALINSIGALGGFAGPAVMGWLRQHTGSFTAGILTMAAIMVLSALLATTLYRGGSGPRQTQA